MTRMSRTVRTINPRMIQVPIASPEHKTSLSAHSRTEVARDSPAPVLLLHHHDRLDGIFLFSKRTVVLDDRRTRRRARPAGSASTARARDFRERSFPSGPAPRERPSPILGRELLAEERRTPGSSSSGTRRESTTASQLFAASPAAFPGPSSPAFCRPARPRRAATATRPVPSRRQDPENPLQQCPPSFAGLLRARRLRGSVPPASSSQGRT